MTRRKSKPKLKRPTQKRYRATPRRRAPKRAESRYEHYLGARGLAAFRAVINAATDDPHTWEWPFVQASLLLAKSLGTPPESRTPEDERTIAEVPGLLKLGPIDYAPMSYRTMNARNERTRARAEVESMFEEFDPTGLLARPENEKAWERLVDRHIALERQRTK